MRVGINGLGRIGRLALRIAAQDSEFEFVKSNDPGGDAALFAHLLQFDSTHGQYPEAIVASESDIHMGRHRIQHQSQRAIAETDWSGVDLVIEASGKFKTLDQLQAYFDQGVQRVLLTAPSKDPAALNLVYGVNHHLYDATQHRLVTAASCTTNCIAPVVKVIHGQFGIEHGSITTIHDITNTQSILDAPHKDLRRARACGTNLIPTTTGSAKAIIDIFPELEGRLDGHAVRVPIANASLTDMVFELKQSVTVEGINTALADAAEGELKGILGYEARPLVSSDYCSDPRSSIIDALSTMVVNHTQLKLYAWYDNEYGYAHRVIDLAKWIMR